MTLANPREVLYLVNRPGNAPSHQGSGEGIARAIALVQPWAGQSTLRGDTDFTRPAHLDRGEADGVKLILGRDACPAPRASKNGRGVSGLRLCPAEP